MGLRRSEPEDQTLRSVRMAQEIGIMTKVEALEEEIGKLSATELAELREWFAERDAEEWDREIERDAASGKLDTLFEKSMADHLAGKSREI